MNPAPPVTRTFIGVTSSPGSGPSRCRLGDRRVDLTCRRRAGPARTVRAVHCLCLAAHLPARRGRRDSRTRCAASSAASQPASRPVTPSETTSATLPTLVATTGTPARPASISETGMPSLSEVSSARSAAAYTVSTSAAPAEQPDRAVEFARPPPRARRPVTVSADDERVRRGAGQPVRTTSTSRSGRLMRGQPADVGDDRPSPGTPSPRRAAGAVRERRRAVGARRHDDVLLAVGRSPAATRSSRTRLPTATSRSVTPGRTSVRRPTTSRVPAGRSTRAAVPVEGVHAGRHPRERGRGTPERAGLRGVGVHDVRPEPPHLGDQRRRWRARRRPGAPSGRAPAPGAAVTSRRAQLAGSRPRPGSTDTGVEPLVEHARGRGRASARWPAAPARRRSSAR